MTDSYSLKDALKDWIGYASQNFGQFEISAPLCGNATTPLGGNMISRNLTQYTCVAHQMKGI